MQGRVCALGKGSGASARAREPPPCFGNGDRALHSYSSIDVRKRKQKKSDNFGGIIDPVEEKEKENER